MAITSPVSSRGIAFDNQTTVSRPMQTAADSAKAARVSLKIAQPDRSKYQDLVSISAQARQLAATSSSSRGTLPKASQLQSTAAVVTTPDTGALKSVQPAKLPSKDLVSISAQARHLSAQATQSNHA